MDFCCFGNKCYSTQTLCTHIMRTELNYTLIETPGLPPFLPFFSPSFGARRRALQTQLHTFRYSCPSLVSFLFLFVLLYVPKSTELSQCGLVWKGERGCELFLNGMDSVSLCPRYKCLFACGTHNWIECVSSLANVKQIETREKGE